MQNAFIANLSVRTKLIAANLLTLAVVLLVTLLALVGKEWNDAHEELVQHLGAYAQMVADSSSAALVFGDKKAAQEILDTLRASDDIYYAAIVESNGARFAEFSRHTSPAPPPSTAILTTRIHRFGDGYLDYFQPIHTSMQQQGMVHIRASTQSITEHVHWYALWIGGLGLGGMILSVPLLLRLQRSVTTPLSKLTALMRDVSNREDYGLRAPVESSDEIGALSSGFNEMLTRIEQRNVALKHELLERKSAEERLDMLAHFDTVTHLPNRHFFNERLLAVVERCLTTPWRAGLLFVDLDNFKIVNDTLGHDVGDQLLYGVAHRLASSVRSGDVVCRIGGDEFAIIAEDLKNADDAEVVAAKALEALRAPFQFGDNEIFVTASIGISIAPDDARDMHELLRNADTAMYFAKERGKSTYQSFLPDMKGKALKRLTMESHLRRAVERNEFVVHYQPQFDVHSRSMVGVEALVRWHHPEFGLVGPNEFIPIAEETGLIVPIGEWVLRQASLDVLAMHEHSGVPLHLAVNLSGRQFKENDIVERILAIIQETAFPPELLEIEITESMLMDISDKTLEKMNALRDAGLSLSLDDFGTGYSSMSYLKRFPISRLKIDRSFVRDVPHDADDAAIVQAIIAMGRTLKMSIVAEGVETSQQADFLRHNGCDNLQGFLLARPMPKEDLATLLQQALPASAVGSGG